MLFHFFYQWASLGALLIVACVALWRGGWPERVAAIAMTAAWLATGIVYNNILQRGVQVAPMVVDALLLSVLLFIALRSNRWWPMWACAFQALTFVLHLAMIADAVLWRRAAWMANSCFSYLTMLALLCGAIRTRRAPAPTDAASPLT